MEVRLTQIPTGWETTRLSKHFILLDFLADHAVYRSGTPLAFKQLWNDEHNTLARGLCEKLLEPIIEAYGPISVSDAFWPSIISAGHHKSAGPKHRWIDGEATVDIAAYEQVDRGHTEAILRRIMESYSAIDGYRDRIISYPNTEFICVTFKSKGAERCGRHDCNKRQNLRAHHIRVGRYFNLLDFCRGGRAVEEGSSLIPEKLDGDTPHYRPIPEEVAARSFAAALDPLVAQVGRISVVRGMEPSQFSHCDHAKMHRWDQFGPWRLVFVLPQGQDPDRACNILKKIPHVHDVQPSSHASDSHALALVLEKADYGRYRGLRPIYVC